MQRLASIRPHGGFTLIEILMVTTIIMILAGIVGQQIVKHNTTARVRATRVQMDTLKSALEQFQMDAGRFPENNEGLDALIERPSALPPDDWAGRYLDIPAVPADGFGTPFEYRAPGEDGFEFELTSAGKDRRFDTDDDLRLSDAWRKRRDL